MQILCLGDLWFWRRWPTRENRLNGIKNSLVSNYAVLFPNKRAKSTLRGIKQRKIQIILLNLDLDILSEVQ